MVPGDPGCSADPGPSSRAASGVANSLLLSCAKGLLIPFPFFQTPPGPGSSLIVAALIVRRVMNPSVEQRLMTQEIPVLG
jgi:hypothetical protein